MSAEASESFLGTFIAALFALIYIRKKCLQKSLEWMEDLNGIDTLGNDEGTGLMAELSCHISSAIDMHARA